MTTNLRRFPDPPVTLPPNLEFVLGLSPSAMTLGLGNIRSLLERLGHPERRFRSVIVAGTNGKGSVTAMLSSILSKQGLRTGRYTSPHVYAVNERVCVNGVPATVDEMESAAAVIAPLRDVIPYSYFEALTAIAFLVFAAREVDVAVLETGLGGRFDATNAVEPELSVITSISLDHRRILGDSLEEILMEKLGITRSGVPLLLGELPAALEDTVREKAARDSFPIIRAGDIAGVKASRGDRGSARIEAVTQLADYGELSLPFPGAHQVINAALAIGAAEKIAGKLDNLAAALGETYLPGRFERIEEAGKIFILDVAHNDDALSAAVKQLSFVSPDRKNNALVLGLLKRKELLGFPSRVPAAVNRVYLVTLDGNDAFAPEELLQKFVVNGLKESDVDVILWNKRSEDDDHWLRLLKHLREPSTPHRAILVTGSHHVVEHFGTRLFARGNQS